METEHNIMLPYEAVSQITDPQTTTIIDGFNKFSTIEEYEYGYSQ